MRHGWLALVFESTYTRCSGGVAVASAIAEMPKVNPTEVQWLQEGKSFEKSGRKYWSQRCGCGWAR